MADNDPSLSRAPLLSHLTELRRRLLHCLLLFVLAFAVCYYFVEPIYHFLIKPLVSAFGENSGRRMIYTGLHEAFITYIKLALFSAFFISIPVILNQLWKFIAPGLYKHERTSLVPVFLATPILFICGAALAFYGVMPLAWDFFLGFESKTPDGVSIELEARVSEYLSLVIRLILAFGLSFELPVILYLLARLGIITADTMVEYRKHAIVLTFALAALITPPDLISQIALGTPILLLYELSILLVRWTDRQQTRHASSANNTASSI